MRPISFLLVLLIVSAANSSAQRRIHSHNNYWGRIDFATTEFGSPKCKAVQNEKPQPAKICPGAAGYRLLVTGPDARPSITVITPKGSRHLLQYWDINAPEFESLASSISWQVARRRGRPIPVALVLSVNVKEDKYSRNQDPYTVIAKVTPAQVCVVGRIRPSGTSAGEVAGLTDTAPYAKCIALSDIGRRDWLGRVYGLIREERYEDAMATVKMDEPSGRGIAYESIAQAQAASGNMDAARRTLLIGLDDARSEKDEAGRKSIRASVIVGMAQVGLYRECKDAIKLLLEPSEVPPMLVMVGKIQGDSHTSDGREDTAAARETFNEAVEIELKRQDTLTADKNLAEIVDGQSQVGLLEEAKKTLSLIRDASARRIAQSHLDWNTPKPD